MDLVVVVQFVVDVLRPGRRPLPDRANSEIIVRRQRGRRAPQSLLAFQLACADSAVVTSSMLLGGLHCRLGRSTFVSSSSSSVTRKPRVLRLLFVVGR